MSEILVAMLDESGLVTEECPAVEEQGVCEDDERPGLVLSWEAADGMRFYACREHLAADDFARAVTG